MQLVHSSIPRLLMFLSLFIFCVVLNDNAQAAPSPRKQARQTVIELRQKIKELRRLLNRDGVRQALANYADDHPDLQDSDSDGLPDILEDVERTDACNQDSDGDGIHDGDESSNPDDNGAAEVEIKGSISALTSSTVTVGIYTFTANADTDFRDGQSLADYAIGQFVEAEGEVVNGPLLLKHIKFEDN